MVQVNTTSDAEKSVAMMTPDEAKAELAQREADKMTRRSALAKVGLRTGMAIFAAFSIDDLARKTATVLSQRSQNNAIVEKLAREMRDAGVSFAGNNGTTPIGCNAAVQDKLDCLSNSSQANLDCTKLYGSDSAYCACEKQKRDRICRCNYHNSCTEMANCNCGDTDCPPEPSC